MGFRDAWPGLAWPVCLAFNSTFVALVVSIVLMFVLHQLQLVQDRLVLDCQTYCDERMIRHLRVPSTKTDNELIA